MYLGKNLELHTMHFIYTQLGNVKIMNTILMYKNGVYHNTCNLIYNKRLPTKITRLRCRTKCIPLVSARNLINFAYIFFWNFLDDAFLAINVFSNNVCTSVPKKPSFFLHFIAFSVLFFILHYKVFYTFLVHICNFESFLSIFYSFREKSLVSN